MCTWESLSMETYWTVLYWNPVTCSLDKHVLSEVVSNVKMVEVTCVDVTDLTAAADHSSWNIFSRVQSQLMQVQTHAGQHLEKSHLLLCDLIDQSRTRGIALRPSAVIDEMKWTAL